MLGNLNYEIFLKFSYIILYDLYLNVVVSCDLMWMRWDIVL